MTKFLSRLGTTKYIYKIGCEITELTITNPKIPVSFKVEWIRGPQKETTEPKSTNWIDSNKCVKVGESFTRLSGFHQNKKGQFMSKNCEFKLTAQYDKGKSYKSIASKKIDLIKYIKKNK